MTLDPDLAASVPPDAPQGIATDALADAAKGARGASGRRRLARSPSALAAWVAVAGFALLGLFGPALASQSPSALTNAPQLLAPLSAGHLLGTDEFGRDELSRLLSGARPLIVTSLAAAAIAAGLGYLIGLVAGYVGGALETFLMRCMDAVLSFPVVLFAIMIVAALGPDMLNLIVAVAITQVPVFARLARALTARERDREYVLAARGVGFSAIRILFVEVTPNIIGAMLVQATSVIGVAAGYESAFSYLGLGIQPPTPDWGYMVKGGQQFIFDDPWLSVLPGLLITLFVLACNFAGDDIHGLMGLERSS